MLTAHYHYSHCFRIISSASLKNDSIRSIAGLSILITRSSAAAVRNRRASWYASNSKYDSCTCSTVDAHRNRYIRKLPQCTRCVRASVSHARTSASENTHGRRHALTSTPKGMQVRNPKAADQPHKRLELLQTRLEKPAQVRKRIRLRQCRCRRHGHP